MQKSIIVPIVALVVALAFAGDADAKRKRRKRKKQKKPVAEKVVESPAVVPEEAAVPPPAEAEPAAAPASESAAADAVAAPADAPPPADAVPADSAAAPRPEVIEASGPPPAPVEEITASTVDTGDPGSAVETDAAAAPIVAASLPSFVVFAGVGGGFSQVVSKLGTGYRAGIQGGYLLPFLDHRLQIYLGAGYAQAGRKATGDDTRLPDGSYKFNLVEQELIVGGGLAGRIWPPGAWLNVVLRAGVDARMQKTRVKANADGAGFGANTETATAVGAVFGSGVELMLGPGAVVGELGFSFADLSHTITGDASTGGIWLRAGYRMFF